MSEFIIVIIIVIGFFTWRFFARLKSKDGTYTVVEHRNGFKYHMTFARNESVKINFKDLEDILCPYCKYRFPKMLARSRKCPECKEYIYKVKDYEKGVYQLLTVKEHEKETKLEADERWMEYSRQIKDQSKAGDYRGLSHTYFLMALQQYNEEKDFIPLLQQHFRFELLEYQRIGCKRVRMIYADGKQGRTYSIEEALNNKLLPYKKSGNIDWHDMGYFEPIL